MICFFPVFQGDCSRLLNLLVWIRQLGGCQDHKAVIVADADTRAGQIIKLKEEAIKSFSTVDTECTDESVKGWIPGANSLFLTAARYAQNQRDPWLFMEPDSVPLCPRWLDNIEIHYRGKSAHYMGELVKCITPGLPSVHLPGVSVYPTTAYAELRETIQSQPDKAFDISTAHLTVPKSTRSELFQALWGEMHNPPTFAINGIPGTGTFGLDYLKPKAVIFHRTKDGKLIDLLRRNMGMKQKAFIQLGRAGDIILALPEMLYLYQTEGLKPIFITSKEFGSILEGVNYVDAAPIPAHWWFGIHDALKYAKMHFGGAVVLQCHGDKWPVDESQPTFMHASHFRSGVPMDLFMKIPMVFDNRSPEREKLYLPKTGGKPYIMVNTTGFSSPFSYDKQLMASLYPLIGKIEIINMANLRLHRIYDLLGLYDKAIGTIHIDTATMHLAHASPTPYIGFSRGGWASSTPRGNCVLNMEYAEYPSRRNEVVSTVESWIP